MLKRRSVYPHHGNSRAPRQVRVTERYYRTYNLLDKQRQKEVEVGKRVVQAKLGEGNGRTLLTKTSRSN